MISKVIIFLSLCVLSFASVLPHWYGNTENMEYFIEPYSNQRPGTYNDRLLSVSGSQQLMQNDLVPMVDENYLEPVYDVSRHKRQAQDKGRRGSISVGAQRTQRGGTDFNAEARAKLWESRDRRSRLEDNTFYQRHYGGRIGTQRPNYGGGITFTHRF